MSIATPYWLVLGAACALGLVLIAVVVAVQVVRERRRRRAAASRVVARLLAMPRPGRPTIGRPPALVAALANFPHQTRTGGEPRA